MGFKARKTFTAKGWIPKSERSFAEIMRVSGAPDPTSGFIYLNKEDAHLSENLRDVKITADITIEEID